MFRYKLRTLLIVLALGPPVLAGAWWLIRSHPYPSEIIQSLILAALCFAYLLTTFNRR